MRVTFYTKVGCHLCDVIKLELLDLQDEFDFVLVEQNILNDEALSRLYGQRIPVVEIMPQNGALAEPIQLEAPISQIDLRRQIKLVAAGDHAAQAQGLE